jgi:hypothetical protein
LVPVEDAVEAFRLAQEKSTGVFRVVVEPQPALGGCVCGGGLASDRVSI